MKDYPIRILVKCGAMTLYFKEDWNIINFFEIAEIK